MVRRLWSGLTWLVTFVYQNFMASVTVAGLVLRPWKPVRSGWYACPST